MEGLKIIIIATFMLIKKLSSRNYQLTILYTNMALSVS